MAANPKHLASGSECPTLKEGQLRLYSMRFCPFVKRTKLVLAAKGVEFEEVRINLSDQPDWYLKKNPVGEVPLLEWIDASSKQTQAVPESLIICDYLDELHPEPRLHPTDPLQKAKQRVLVGRFGQVLSPFYQVFRQTEGNPIDELNAQLKSYEDALQETFFGGSKPAMIDYMLWPWFELLPALKDSGYVLNADGKLPKLEAWVKAMEADAVVQKVKLPQDTIKRYVATMRQGKTDYDVE